MELAVLVGNKELIVAGPYYWQKNDLVSLFILIQGVPPKVMLYCLCAFGLDFCGEQKTSESLLFLKIPIK